jgi:hypothetical protein
MAVVKNNGKQCYVCPLTGGEPLVPMSRKSRPSSILKFFDGKSLFELTAARNKDIANQIIVVGNIDNCHLSEAILEKQELLIWISLSLRQRYGCCDCFCRFCLCS